MRFPDPSWAGGQAESVGEEGSSLPLCARILLDFRLADLGGEQGIQDFCNDLVIDIAEALYVVTERVQVISIGDEPVACKVCTFGGGIACTQVWYVCYLSGLPVFRKHQ